MSVIIYRIFSVMFMCGLIFTGSVHAQQSTLRVILPIGPGSAVDGMIRTAGPALSQALGQNVVIENMPGAGGITGTSALVKAEPNGNIIAFVSNNHVVNPSVFKSMPFDSLKDITPISIVGNSPFVLVVNAKTVSAKNAKELQAFLKAKPDEYNYGSSGNGTIIHLAGEMFVQAADVKVRHIPYKGMGPMVTDLISGQVQMGAAAISAVQAQIKNGTLRAIGVMGKNRAPSLPDVPTLAEQGFPEVDVQGWFAAIGPAKLPADQVARIHAGIVKAFNDPLVKERLLQQDNLVDPSTPEVAQQYFKSEHDTYAKLIQKAGLKVD